MRLLFVVVMVLAGCRPAPFVADAAPVGSKVTCWSAVVYLEAQQPDGSWAPAKFTPEGGGEPVRGAEITGYIYGPVGQRVRMRFKP